MIANGRQGASKARALGRGLLSVALLCCLTDVACPQESRKPAYDVRARRLDGIAPGTVIGSTAPDGWTHLILKSHPRPGAGDFRRLSRTQAGWASMLVTAIVADVKQEHDHYRLARVGVGLASRIGDRDVIVTPATYKRLGADLGWIGGKILDEAQARLDLIVTAARSPTMTVFDAPNLMLRDGEHRPVVLRYAVLVDESTGRVDTLLWLLDRTGEGLRGPVGVAEWLAPNTADDCVLNVDSRHFLLGQPREQAFALSCLPRGDKQLDLSGPLAVLASRPRLSAVQAAQLEEGLRDLLKAAGGK